MERRWAKYLRVSSDLQAKDDRYGLPRQRYEIDGLLRSLGVDPTQVREFVDVISGTKERREALDRLLELARAGQITHLALSQNDRLARNFFTAAALMGEMIEAGLEVWFAVGGRFDPTDPRSRRDFALDSADSDYDHAKIVKRLYDGKLAKARGNPYTGQPGRPPVPVRAYGHPDNAAATEAERQTARWIFEHICHAGEYVTARTLNERGIPPPRGALWRASSIRAILRNPVYKGEYQYGRRGERVSVPVTALVTAEEWARANEAVRQRRRSGGRLPGSRLADFPLQRHIFCGLCGGAMSGYQPSQKSHRYYFCRRTLYRESARSCEHNIYHRADELHAAVLEALRGLRYDPERLREAIRVAIPEPARLEMDQAILEQRRANLITLYETGRISLAQFDERMARLDELGQRLLQPPQPIPVASAEDVARRLEELWEQPLHILARDLRLRVTVTPPGLISLEVG